VEQETNRYNVPGPAGAPRPLLDAPPAAGTPHPAAPAGNAPGSAVKKKWWSMPKLLVAAGLAVLLAGAGGGAIGFAMGKSDAAQQFSQRLQNGRPNGATGQGRRSPGPGQAQPTSPATPGSSNNP
jgi:hypothetical protein